MCNEDFYKTLKLIYDHRGTVALIDSSEFIRLIRVKNNFKWIPLEIDLPYIPIVTTDFEQQVRQTKDRSILYARPIRVFGLNGEKVITPKNERFLFTEENDNIRHLKTFRQFKDNPRFLNSNNWIDNLYDGYFATRQNAIEWNKEDHEVIFTPISDENYEDYLRTYNKEIKVFCDLYDESVLTTLELKKYQKTLTR